MKWLRAVFGLHKEFLSIHRRLDGVHEEILALRSDFISTFRDEFDSDRKALSDKLAERAIAKLKAEDWARKQTGGPA